MERLQVMDEWDLYVEELESLQEKVKRANENMEWWFHEEEDDDEE